jgi:hypothetical protein
MAHLLAPHFFYPAQRPWARYEECQMDAQVSVTGADGQEGQDLGINAHTGEETSVQAMV